MKKTKMSLCLTSRKTIIGIVIVLFNIQGCSTAHKPGNSGAPKDVQSTSKEILMYHFITRHAAVECPQHVSPGEKCPVDPVLTDCGNSYAETKVPKFKNDITEFRSSTKTWVFDTLKPAADAIEKTVLQEKNVYTDAYAHLFTSIGAHPGSNYTWAMRRSTNTGDGIASIFQQLKNSDDYITGPSCNELDFSNTDTAYAYYLRVKQKWTLEYEFKLGIVSCLCTGQKPGICTAHRALKDC